MKKDTVWLIVAIVLLVGVIGGLVWLFGGFSGMNDAEVPETENQEQVQDTEEQQTEPTEEQEQKNGDPNVVEENEELGDAQVDSSVEYSTSSQSVGRDTEEVFSLNELSVVKGESVVEIKYVFSGSDITEESSLPVSVVNKSSLGAMEIVIDNVESDGTGMGFDESKSINKDGLTKLTKVVSGQADTLKYNLGFTNAPEYYLYEPEVSGQTVVVKLSVKYPGGEISTEEFGTTEFTTEDISVESSTADEGVRISGYSYSVTGGVLRYVFKTSTNTGSPIPSFEASIGDGILTITFPSLNADVIYSASGDTVSLPGGVILNISRSGNQSVYEFVGIGDQYKLYGEISPNQVVAEIEL